MKIKGLSAYLFYRIAKIPLINVFARNILATKVSHNIPGQSENLFQQVYSIKILDKDGSAFNFNYRNTHSDRSLVNQIIINEQYSIEWLPQSKWINQRYLQILNDHKIPCIIDVGANIGAASVYFHHSYPAAKIVALEPAENNLVLLNRNTKHIQCKKIIKGAVNSFSDTTSLFDPGHGEWGYSSYVSKPPSDISSLETVKSYRMNELLPSDTVPFIIKIDIEGAEVNEFYDTAFFSEFALIVIELHDWLYPGKKTSQSFLRLMASLDFDLVHNSENIFLFNRSYS